MRLAVGLIFITNAAWAECASHERTFMACQFENGKAVEVCTTDEEARYAFGVPGQTPELAMSLAFGQGAEAVPWNGVGRTIWEGVRLTNNDVVYEVYGGFDRLEDVEWDPATEASPAFGGVVVEDGKGNELAHLHCVAGTVDYAF